MCYNMLHKKRWGIFMSIFDRDNKNELDENQKNAEERYKYYESLVGIREQ